GIIVSYFWEEITNTGAIITNPNDNNTTVTVSADYVKLQVTVTDNEGATGTDTLELFKAEDHAISLTETSFANAKHYELVVNPDISEGSAINIKGLIKLVNEGENI